MNAVSITSSNVGLIKGRLFLFVRKRVVGYSIVGGFVLVLGLTTLITLAEVVHLNKLLAGYCSTIVSVETNFFLNWKYNWGDRKIPLRSAWIKFHGARGLTLLFNQFLYTVLVLAGLWYLAATMTVTLFAMVYNYIINDKFAFRKSGGK